MKMDTQLDNLKKSAQFLVDALSLLREAMENEERRKDLVIEARVKIDKSTIPLESINETMRPFTRFLTIMHNFMSDCCNQSVECITSSKVLYEHFRAWCSDNGVKPGNQALFSKNLLEYAPELKLSRVNGEYRFQGIGLKE